MNPNNPLYEYADKLNEYGVKLVKKFMHSKQYCDLRSKINDIDKEVERLNIEHERKLRELKKARRAIELYEIPKAKDEYVREHIEGYKMHLRTKDADDPIKAYMQIIKSESSHR